jgi:hypothetical protein
MKQGGDMVDKKKFEVGMLRRMLDQMGIPATVLEERTESPDCAIELHGTRIGVEVTQVQKDEAQRARFTRVRDLVEQARNTYTNAGGRSRVVHFHLNSRESFRIDRVALGKRIARLLLTLGDEDVAITGRDVPSDLSAFVWGMTTHVASQELWYPSQATWVAPFTVELFQERIDAKRRKLQTYRSKEYAEVWLLICADMANPATQFDNHVDFDPTQVESPFDRTYFCNGWQSFRLGTFKT